MNQTVSYYDEHAKDFCKATVNADMSFCRDKFMKYLPTGAHILDAGCGSGRDSKAFLEAGFQVTAIDASPHMCIEAENLLHQKVSCMPFEDMDFQDEFDGIWACASLVHVTKREITDILLRLKRALKQNGIFYASFKYGEGERTVQGRFFNDYEEKSFRKLLEKQGFAVQELFITEDVRMDRAGKKWINVVVENTQNLLTKVE